MKNCQKLVEAHLLRGGSLTQITAMTPKFDFCGNLPATIRRLRLKHGRASIVTNMVKTKSGVYGKYSMPL